MFPTNKRILQLHLGTNVVRNTADHPVFVIGRGWLAIAELRVGDRMRTLHGYELLVEVITDRGETEVVQATATVVNHSTGMMPAGTMIESADGPKPIEQVKVGDYITVPRPLDPERN